MLSAGKKTRAWERERRKLKIEFEAVGITRCEFHYEGCWINNGLSFAHIDKRRFLTPLELSIVALSCCVCHDILELKPREEMRRVILSVIKKRICQPYRDRLVLEHLRILLNRVINRPV